MKGELIQFVSPAPALKAKKDEDGGKQNHNQEAELVDIVDIATQESAEVVEPIFVKDVEWGESPPSYYNQQGELVEFITSAN